MNFKKTNDYLICIDSDGCAIDTMTIKHQKCFGPSIISTWNLEEFEKKILSRWDEINLYSITRGVNRFKGLAIILKEIDEKYTTIDGLNGYLEWVQTAKQFSNNFLSDYADKTNNICSQKALEWTLKVNDSINKLDDKFKVSYKGCKEALQKISELADIAVVSSANRQAVEEEWKQNDLLEYVSGVFAQDTGTKAYCISQLLLLGYDKNNVVKIGDAMGDLDAAKSNGVHFYPILINKETESWSEFSGIALEKLINNDFSNYSELKIEQFYAQFK